MPTSGPFEIVKPFAWMALAAFLVGFFSYFLFHGPEAPVATDTAGWTSTVSGPSSAEWNSLKPI